MKPEEVKKEEVKLSEEVLSELELTEISGGLNQDQDMADMEYAGSGCAYFFKCD